MSRLTRDRTAETVSRDQILRHERGQGNIHFRCSADHEQDWQPYPIDPYSCYMVLRNAAVRYAYNSLMFWNFPISNLSLAIHTIIETVDIMRYQVQYTYTTVLLELQPHQHMFAFTRALAVHLEVNSNHPLYVVIRRQYRYF